MGGGRGGRTRILGWEGGLLCSVWKPLNSHRANPQSQKALGPGPTNLGSPVVPFALFLGFWFPL